jgi:hypothetical protein
MTSTFTHCPRLYAIQYVRNRRRNSPSISLSFGGLIHTGLASYYETLQEGGSPVDATLKALNAVSEAAYEDPVEDYRTRARAALVLKQYGEKWLDEPSLKILMTEGPFTVSIPSSDGGSFQWGGRIDLVVEYGERLWVMDHKTTSVFSRYYFDNFDLDPQMHGYRMAAEILSRREIFGVIINVLIIHKRDAKFERRAIPLSRFHTDAWRTRQEHLLGRIADIRKMDPKGDKALDPSVWPPNTENCVGKYGPCSAHQVCILPSVRAQEVTIHNEWHHQTWDWEDPQ